MKKLMGITLIIVTLGVLVFVLGRVKESKGTYSTNFGDEEEYIKLIK